MNKEQLQEMKDALKKLQADMDELRAILTRLQMDEDEEEIILFPTPPPNSPAILPALALHEAAMNAPGPLVLPEAGLLATLADLASMRDSR